MIKKNLNADSRAVPSSFLILLGVLKGYLKRPLVFLVTSKISFVKFRKKIDLDMPGEFIDSYGFIAWLYIRLKDKIGKDNSFEILRAGLITSGLAVQQANFKCVESEKRYEFRVTRCLFYELFRYLNVHELTAIMCSIDNAIFNSYLPEKLTFHRNGLNKTFLHGNGCCEFVIENNESV